MNSRQKEVLQEQLDDEKTVIRKLKVAYGRAMAETEAKIQTFTADIQLKKEALQSVTDASQRALLESEIQSKVYQKQYQEALKGQISAIFDNLQSKQYDTIKEYLDDSYTKGFTGTMYDLHGQGIPLILPIDQTQVVDALTMKTKLSKPLYQRLGVDIDSLKKVVNSEISRGIATGRTWAEIAQIIDRRKNINLYRASRIARTEGHRVQQTAAFDAMKKAKGKGADLVKQWVATLDDRTRPDHALLDGQIREVDEPFEVSGYQAMMPGQFGIASEDIHCRCAALQRARWALDDEELQTLKDRAAYFGLDKSKDFDDFTIRYLQATKQPVVPVGTPITINGVSYTKNIEQFGFGDGRGGIKKTINAVTYTTSDGTKFVFPKKYNKQHQTMTPEQALKCWEQVPDGIRRKAPKTIEFVDYYNPMDSYWKKHYKGFTHSYATGGDTITFYRYDYEHDEDYVIRTYCHESGHFIDTSLPNTSGRYCEDAAWTKAMADDIIVSGKKSPTLYGQNAKAEDYADSVSEYVHDKDAFKRDFPNRAKLLESIIQI